MYEIGGFLLPFAVAGSFTLVMAILLFFVIPTVKVDKTPAANSGQQLTITKLAKVSFRMFHYSFCS